MPHIHLDTTANLEENSLVPEILGQLATKLATFETVTPQSVKAYASCRTQWAMGEGAAKGFIHLQVSILSGRDLTLRKSIAWAMQQILKERFAKSLESGEASLTIEIREMDSETYLK